MPESRPSLLVDLTVSEFSERLASGDPAPGGGSAAALAGALAAGLAAMVARLTIGRPQYDAAQETMRQLEAQAERLRRQLLALVDADTAAYTNVMDAYRLPRETPEQKSERAAAIQDALKHAADIPLATAEACVQVVQMAALAAQQGNRNANSDAAVAGMLAHAALQGAVRNVRINLSSIKDGGFVTTAEARVAGLAARGEAALRRATAE
jgi:formiminotetrahydrofolate cyclodeaminase